MSRGGLATSVDVLRVAVVPKHSLKFGGTEYEKQNPVC